MEKLRAYNQGKTARLQAGRINPTVLEAMKSHADELGLSLVDYLTIAEVNFWASQPYLQCKACGALNVVDEEQMHTQLFPSENCRKCGADNEIAFGI